MMEHKIIVTYRCWGCGSEKIVMERSNLPIPSKEVWNVCKECRKKEKK
jgi:hypothetical protein